jgi:hypothetical protein
MAYRSHPARSCVSSSLRQNLRRRVAGHKHGVGNQVKSVDNEVEICKGNNQAYLRALGKMVGKGTPLLSSRA